MITISHNQSWMYSTGNLFCKNTLFRTISEAQNKQPDVIPFYVSFLFCKILKSQSYQIIFKNFPYNFDGNFSSFFLE